MTIVRTPPRVEFLKKDRRPLEESAKWEGWRRVGLRRRREEGGGGAGPWAERASLAPGGRLPQPPAAAGIIPINFSSLSVPKLRLASTLLDYLFTPVMLTLQGRVVKRVLGLGLEAV